ncbi:lamin tail domain-containing protein [Akkermansiaceae bacterium]|nr:lamin tail domain-containing protein [Akkermansiaceae bacterium]
MTSFGLSDDGETVYLTSAVDDQLTEYRFKEDFGASLEGQPFGYYRKPSTGGYNFITLSAPTQAAANAGPKVGPIVISEIMYNPAGAGAAEYFEILNISDSNVTLFDATQNKAWKFTGGIEYEFPALSPLTMTPGQRVVLTRSIPDFNASYTVPSGTLVIEWITGKLSNGGESLQLGQPGPVNALNETQFVRVDRVKYDNNSPWVSSPDGGGPSLGKIAEKEYGNDYINWTALAGIRATFLQEFLTMTGHLRIQSLILYWMMIRTALTTSPSMPWELTRDQRHLSRRMNPSFEVSLFFAGAFLVGASLRFFF